MICHCTLGYINQNACSRCLSNPNRETSIFNPEPLGAEYQTVIQDHFWELVEGATPKTNDNTEEHF